MIHFARPKFQQYEPSGRIRRKGRSISDVADSRLEDAVAAIREFTEDQRRSLWLASWTEVEMCPSEKTIGRQLWQLPSGSQELR